MSLLSVIIPIYKVEQYLRPCVDSVLAQGLDDYELILVDDGSPDACPRICDEYAGRSSQIRVIHQSNGGLSAARNAGIRAATGRYIIFLDGDDWWDPRVSVGNMLAEAQERPDVDLFVFPSLDYYEGKGLFERSDSVRGLAGAAMDPAAYYRTMLAAGNLQVSAATKIIRAEFLRRNALFFRCGITGEDNEWIIRLLRCRPRIWILPEPLYICRMGRPGSISNAIGKRNVSDLIGIVSRSLAHYADPNADRSVMDHELCFCAYLWFCALGLSGGLPPREWKELSRLFAATGSVCKYSRSPKTKAAYLLYRTAGLSLTRRLLHRYIVCKRAFRWNARKAGPA